MPFIGLKIKQYSAGFPNEGLISRLFVIILKIDAYIYMP